MITEALCLTFIGVCIHLIKKDKQFKYDDIVVEDRRRRELLKFADMLAERKSTRISRSKDEGNTRWDISSDGFLMDEPNLGYFKAGWYNKTERMNIKKGVFKGMSYRDFKEVLQLLKGRVTYYDHKTKQDNDSKCADEFLKAVKS